MRTLVAAVLVATGTSAPADNIFAPAGGPGQRVFVTIADAAPSPEDLTGPPMLARTHGLLAELKGKQVAELIESADQGSAAGSHMAGATVCVVHIGLDTRARHIRILQSLDGSYLAELISGPTSTGRPAAQHTVLKPECFERILLPGATAYLGGFGAGAVRERLAETFEVSHPYQRGVATLDTRSIQDRLGASGYIRFDPVHLDLAKERFLARLPRDYRPERPAGLLVWMDPGDNGRPPDAFAAALDQLNLVCIGAAGAGNERGVTDRLQLALDAVATAERRWHIDPQRVYVAGASGGGKMASVLMPCFPDVFHGGVAVVGLASWQPVPTGDGAHTWPAEFTRPKDRLWRAVREHRLAVVTGSNDFNRPQILKTFDRLKAEGPAMRLFDIDGLGHELPRPAGFAEQLAWVDEPAAKAAAAREAEATAALDTFGDRANVAQLLDIVQRWPWTRAAWRAIDRLPPDAHLPEHHPK